EPVRGPSAKRLVVFQETALFPWMTTFQNVLYGPMVQRNRAVENIEAEAIALLEHVGLKDFRDKYPSQLSGGMQRRADPPREIINNPKLMMLDEPFRGLDAMTRELMQEYFLKLYESRKQSVFFVTSEIDEAIFLADQLLIMSNRPGEITKTINIDLPRPRTPDVLTSTEYLRYKDESLEVLHREAVKAFAEGSKAAADFLEAYAEQMQDGWKRCGLPARNAGARVNTVNKTCWLALRASCERPKQCRARYGSEEIPPAHRTSLRSKEDKWHSEPRA